MLALLFTLWGLGLSTTLLGGIAVLLFLHGQVRLAEVAVLALLIVGGSGYLYRTGYSAGYAVAEAKWEAAEKQAEAELKATADAAIADANQRAASDDATTAALQQKVADYERTLGQPSTACVATPGDAAHFGALVPGR